MQHIIEKIASEHNLKRRSGRWVGQCPECGGSSGSDKFNLRDDGGYKCYGCDFKGDIITWLRKKEGMSCGQAHQEAGKVCNNPSCPVRSTCRMGDGTGRPKYRPAVVAPRAQATSRLPDTKITYPNQRWQQWAEAMTAAGLQNIQTRQADLAWLSRRGIGADSVIRFNLGWMVHNSKIDRQRIGLGPRDDGKKHLWIPDGLIIPIFDDYAYIHRLRIRRPQAARDRFLPDLKYVWLEGSGTGPMIIRPESGVTRGAVIVEAELDGMAVAAAHDQVLVIALGTVRAGIPSKLHEELAALPVVLVCLDADPGKDGKTGAGPQAIAAWTAGFRQAKFWPVPDGKDPGNYAELGGDLEGWIEAGLVPEVVSHDEILMSGCNPMGGPGRPEKEGAGNESVPLVGTITVPDGRVLHITNDQPTWLQLAGAGKIVFTENELQRLQSACLELTAAEAEIMKSSVLDTKEVMGTAYVFRGGAV